MGGGSKTYRNRRAATICRGGGDRWWSWEGRFEVMSWCSFRDPLRKSLLIYSLEMFRVYDNNITGGQMDIRSEVSLVLSD